MTTVSSEMAGSSGNAVVKLSDEVGIRREPLQDGRPVAAHLVGRLDRHAHLRFQRRRAAIPEELLAPGEIPQGRRVAPQRLRPVRARACRRPSVKARAGRWQLAHECRPVPDRRGSANSCAPSAIFSGVSGLSAGAGGVSGRLKMWRHSAAVSGVCAARGVREQAQEGCRNRSQRLGVPARHPLSPVNSSPGPCHTQALEQIDRWIPGTRPGMTSLTPWPLAASSAARRATGFSWIGQLSSAASTPSPIEIHHIAS